MTFDSTLEEALWLEAVWDKYLTSEAAKERASQEEKQRERRRKRLRRRKVVRLDSWRAA